MGRRVLVGSAFVAGVALITGCSSASDQDQAQPMGGMGSAVPPPSQVLPGAGTGGDSMSPASSAGGSALSTAGSNGALPAGSSASTAGSTTDTAGSGEAGATVDPADLPHFSFFVTSLAAMQRLSGSPDGFGGDLRYGEADGLAGADKICSEIAEASMPGASAKTWRAFLSVVAGPDGNPVAAIDRVGDGPWYDRLGRVLAMSKDALLNSRPEGADAAIADDFPNEDGVPNHAPDGVEVDNHDILTGSDDTGHVYMNDPKFTCRDWTSSVPTDGSPRVGHSWPRNFGGGFGGSGGGFPFPGGGFAGSGFPGFGGTSGFAPQSSQVDPAHWISSLDEAGCAAGAMLMENGPPLLRDLTVGSGGGYGGIYCFALSP